MDPEEVRSLVKTWVIIGVFFALAALFYALGWYKALLIYALVLGAVGVLAILIQSGRGGGLAASLGGIGGDSLLGARSATPIAKATYVMLALLFFIAMLMARMGAPKAAATGLMSGIPAPAAPAEESPTPAAPATTPAAPVPTAPAASTPAPAPGEAQPGEPARP